MMRRVGAENHQAKEKRMKITVRQAREMWDGLRMAREVEFPSAVAFRLSGVVGQLQPVVENFESVRNQLVEKYGRKDEKTGLATVTPDQQEEFDKELKPLLEEPVELDIEPISLKRIEHIDIPLGAMVGLRPIFGQG